MDDLISRQTAIDAAYRYISQFDAIDANFLDGLKEAINIVKTLPSAQPEIVYCNDCVLWETTPSNTVAPEFHKCKKLRISMMGTDFCSFGRREYG